MGCKSRQASLPELDNFAPGPLEGKEDVKITHASRVWNPVIHGDGDCDGDGGNWEDMYGNNTPPAHDRYNPDHFTTAQRDEAFRRKIDGARQRKVKVGIRDIELEGGFLSLTIDPSSMKGELGQGKDFVQSILEREPERPATATKAKARWEIIKEEEEGDLYASCQVIVRLDWGDCRARILVCRGSTCRPFDTRPGVNHYAESEWEQKDMHAEMLEFVARLRTFLDSPNEEFEVDCSLDRLLCDSVLFSYHGLKYFMRNFHGAATSGVLLMKEYTHHMRIYLRQLAASSNAATSSHAVASHEPLAVSATSREESMAIVPYNSGAAVSNESNAMVEERRPSNLFFEGFNSRVVKGKLVGGMLLKPDRNRLLFPCSSASRKKSNDSDSGSQRKNDRYVYRRAVNALSQARVGNKAESTSAMSHVMEVLSTGITSSAKRVRSRSFSEQNTFIRGPLLVRFDAAVEQQKGNSGNTTGTRSASDAEISHVDQQLLQSTGKWILLQATGVAGQNFVPPQGDFVFGSFEFGDGQDAKPLTFSSFQFVDGITHGGVKERVKPKKLQNNTGHTQSLKFHDYQLKKLPGMWKDSDYSAVPQRPPNKQNVICVQLRLKPSSKPWTPQNHVDFIAAVRAATAAGVDIADVGALVEFLVPLIPGKDAADIGMHLQFARGQVCPENDRTFTPEETSALLHGITRFGIGGTAHTSVKETFFDGSPRTAQSIRDKWKSNRKEGFAAITRLGKMRFPYN